MRAMIGKKSNSLELKFMKFEKWVVKSGNKIGDEAGVSILNWR